MDSFQEITSQGISVSIPDSISQKAADIFKRLYAIVGNDPAAMDKAQLEVDKLKGQPASPALACAIRRFLKTKKWAVRCRCGQMATVVFVKNRFTKYRKKNGAKLHLIPMMRFSHIRHSGTHGWTEVHGGTITLPRLILMPRPDKEQQTRLLLSTPLSENATSVVNDLRQIKGSAQTAMGQAQIVLARLVGEPGTEALAYTLKLFLRDKKWGVRCPCGLAATFGWLQTASMAIWHVDARNKVVWHRLPDTMPYLELMERPRRPGSGRRRKSA